MRLRDYFRGYSLVMQSRLRRAELERRINAATLSVWRPFQTGVGGWVHFGRIRLRYRTRFIEYNAAPILAGRIDDEFGIVRLRLRYRAPLPIYPFFAFWYAFLTFILVTFVAGGGASGSSGDENAIFIGMIVFLLLLPMGMHYAFTRRADANFDRIVKFLEDAAEAKVVSGGRPKAR